MVVAKTTLPVIGVPVKTRTLNGIDSLLSIVQMPGSSCSNNCDWLSRCYQCWVISAEILSIDDLQLAERIQARRQSLEKAVMESGEQLE